VSDKADIEPDISAVIDRKEAVVLMEPLLIAEGSRHRGELTDLAIEVAARSAGFRRSLPDGVRTALADLVRAMNCYYSNLIEGHDTHPIDIERALKNDYSNDPRKRDLQLEAKAHISVQRWIDAGGLAGRSLSLAGIKEIHRRFCELLPDDLLWIENPDTGERLKVVPGRLRDRDVRVGTSLSAPVRFRDFSRGARTAMAVWEKRMQFSQLPRRTTACCGYTRSLMAMGASHDWYHTRVSSRLWIPVASGRLHAVSPEMSRLTKAISPIAIGPAGTILMGAAI
jgi:hypothetical protein